MGILYVTVGGEEISLPTGSQIPFTVWNTNTSYRLGQVIIGPDGNQYRSIANSNLNFDPTSNDGSKWELYYLRNSITLNCGTGQRFAGSTSDPAGIKQALAFIQNAAGAASPLTATITIQVANGNYNYGANSISINLPIIGPNVTIQGSMSTVTCPTFYPALSTSLTGGFITANTYYVAITYTWGSGAYETLAGPVTSIATSGPPGTTNTITVASFALPTGATGAKLYVSTDTTLHYQGTFTISAGTSQSFLLTTYNNTGIAPPIINPAASAYPVALGWGAVSNGISISSSSIIINGFFLYGSGTSTSILIQAGYCNKVTITNVIFSNANQGMNIGTGSFAYVTWCQVDNCPLYGIRLSQSNLSLQYAATVYCGNGANLQFLASLRSVSPTYFGSNTTGIISYDGSYAIALQTTANMQTFFSCSSVSSPALNTNGNANSYVRG